MPSVNYILVMVVSVCIFVLETKAEVPGNVTWSVPCCDLWVAMSQFTIEKTGMRFTSDKTAMQLGACEEQKLTCKDMKIIHIFIEQIQVILGKANIQQKNDHLKITLPSSINDDIMQMLALSVIGRVIGVPDFFPEAAVQLVYDTQYDKLSIQRPTCEYSKSIYNSIVLASVVLLIFFIGMQVIERDFETQTRTSEKQSPTLPENQSSHQTIQSHPISNAQQTMQMRLPFKL